MSFDWQSERDEEWVDLSPAAKLRRSRTRLVVLVLLTSIVCTTLWVVTRQSKEGVRKIEADVLASYKVIETAARGNDLELFANFSSSKDPAWTKAWQQLMAEEAYGNRETYGLIWQPAVDPLTSISATNFDPEYNAAELIVNRAYSCNTGSITETIHLQQTYIFHRGPNHWLLVPPDETFWGPMHVLEKTRMSFTVPEHDLPLATQLAADLDDMLARLCDDPLFNCPPDFHLYITMETDPAALSGKYHSFVFVRGQWAIRLPTPTLVGLPQDDAAYQALRSGYGRQLINPVLRQLNGINLFASMPFLNAWLDWQLAQLAVQAYPLQPADWQMLARQKVTLSDSRQAFSTNGPATPKTYAIIDFFMEDAGVSPERMKETFTGGKLTTYEGWLDDLTDGKFSLEELEARWQAYVQIRAGLA